MQASDCVNRGSIRKAQSPHLLAFEQTISTSCGRDNRPLESAGWLKATVMHQSCPPFRSALNDVFLLGFVVVVQVY